MAYQRNSQVLPLIETVRPESQPLHIELGNCASEKELLKQELVELWSQIETERADRKEIEAEFSEKEQNSAPAAKLSEKLTPDAATILSQLRASRKKSKTDLADLAAILEILESWGDKSLQMESWQFAENLRSSGIEEDLLGAANAVYHHPTSYDFPNR